jgi:hypothetical protein
MAKSKTRTKAKRTPASASAKGTGLKGQKRASRLVDDPSKPKYPNARKSKVARLTAPKRTTKSLKNDSVGSGPSHPKTPHASKLVKSTKSSGSLGAAAKRTLLLAENDSNPPYDPSHSKTPL